MTPLDLFLTGDGRDGAGRTHADVLALDDIALEDCHDFIQWLFPLPEASRAVPGSPVLDRRSVARLQASSEARVRLRTAATRMLLFYERTRAWRRPFDHNHLRITRIIKSLRLLCGDVLADDFRDAILVLAAQAPIDPSARRFWDAA